MKRRLAKKTDGTTKPQQAGAYDEDERKVRLCLSHWANQTRCLPFCRQCDLGEGMAGKKMRETSAENGFENGT